MGYSNFSYSMLLEHKPPTLNNNNTDDDDAYNNKERRIPLQVGHDDERDERLGQIFLLSLNTTAADA